MSRTEEVLLPLLIQLSRTLDIVRFG